MSLLAALSSALPGASSSWTDLAVVSNVGPAWDPRALPGNLPSNRGFNAVLFGRGRRPSHYVKVRSADHLGFRREAALTARVSAASATRGLVPKAEEVVTSRLRALALEWVPGPDLFECLRGADEGVRAETAGQLLTCMLPLGSAADAAGQDPSDPFSDAESEVWVLREALGLDSVVADGLLTRLTETPLPEVRQHGDLWPRNLLRAEDGWQVIDFETFGVIDVPCYDLLHLLRGCAPPPGALPRTAAQWPAPFHWLEWWTGALRRVSAGHPLRASVAVHTSGLAPHEFEAAVARYVVSLTARQRAKGDLRTSAALMRQVRALPVLLASGLAERAAAQFLPTPS